MKLLFVTDPHGSTTVFRKALEKAETHRVDVLVIGGDLQGKFLIPVFRDKEGIVWEDPITGDQRRGPRASLEEAMGRISSVGGYGFPVSPEDRSDFNNESDYSDIFVHLAKERLAAWVSELEEFTRRTGIAAILNPGNDDDLELDTLLHESPYVSSCDGRVVEVRGVWFASIAEVPPTPWNTARELPEGEMRRRLDTIASFNIPFGTPFVLCTHSPPRASGLDTAPLLNRKMEPVILGGVTQWKTAGSIAVREFLEATDSVPLSLHGHIHEAGGFAHIGRTLCLNPGSEYGRGVLWYYVADITGFKVKAFERYMA